MLLSGLGFQLSALAVQTATLNWNASTATNVAGYKIYYGTSSHNYTRTISLGNVTTTTVPGLFEGTTYFFAATTFNTSGTESGFSNEASYVVPGVSTNLTNPVPPTNQPPVQTNKPSVQTNQPPVFQSPTLTGINNITINQNAALQTVGLAGISSGTTNPLPSLGITAVSSNPALIPNPTVNYSAPNIAGTLTFTPAHNATGTATITVTVNNGQAQNNIVTRSFTVTVKPVSLPPTLNPVGNFVIVKNSGQLNVNLSGITSGMSGQNQKIKVTASASNRSLISSAIVNYASPKTTGALTLKTMRNATGTTTVTVTVNNGAKSNNITTQTFTVTVLAQKAVKPVVLNLLTNKVIVAGQTATFAVVATGTGPLNYQWKFNGAILPAKTNATLMLNNVTTNQSGVYSATISNLAGSTNSPPAALIVYPTTAATLTSATSANGQFTFDVSGVPGFPYTVQASSNLVDWESLETNTAPFTFTDTDASSHSQRYYRTVSGQ